MPGGGLELGETINECITREIEEEMGIDEKDVYIHDGIILAMENHIKDSAGKLLLDENGKSFYGIELVKKVDITADKIESQENILALRQLKYPNWKMLFSIRK
jgi:8-oxo-dGTP pyrophosphatase MutT (NUDIX family)